MSRGVSKPTIASLIMTIILILYMYKRITVGVSVTATASISHSNTAIMHTDAMKLAAQKNEYHWFTFSTFDSSFW